MMYGGNFASGGYFEGIKPIFKKHNVTVYETIYGLGNTLPGAAVVGVVLRTTKILVQEQPL